LANPKGKRASPQKVSSDSSSNKRLRTEQSVSLSHKVRATSSANQVVKKKVEKPCAAGSAINSANNKSEFSGNSSNAIRTHSTSNNSTHKSQVGSPHMEDNDFTMGDTLNDTMEVGAFVDIASTPPQILTPLLKNVVKNSTTQLH